MNKVKTERVLREYVEGRKKSFSNTNNFTSNVNILREVGTVLENRAWLRAYEELSRERAFV